MEDQYTEADPIPDHDSHFEACRDAVQHGRDSRSWKTAKAAAKKALTHPKLPADARKKIEEGLALLK